MGSMLFPAFPPAAVFALWLPFVAPSEHISNDYVTYNNPQADGVTLAGTLATPARNTPVPAVLLISGAGPQDRDETIAGHKPFLVLSESLTRRGIAVLRTDDRGTGESTGSFERATTSDLAGDARAGVRFLLARQGIDPKHVGLIGHGEGAIIAALLASEMPEISFAVLVGGTSMPGSKVLLAQTARAQAAAGLPDEQIEADYRLGSGLYRMVVDGRSESDMSRALAAAPEEYRPFIDAWRKQLPRLQSPWLRQFLTYDPSDALEKVKCPVLALFGEKDVTLDPGQNASAMKKALGKAHNRDAQVKVLPGLNHLLQKANTGFSSEYAGIRETMAPAALEEIDRFVTNVTSAAPAVKE